MQVNKRIFSHRLFMLFGLFFLGGMLQYMIGIFGFETKHFLPNHITHLPMAMEVGLSIVSGIGLISGAIFNQYLARTYGLKRVLLFGFFINLIALICMTYVHLGKGPLDIIYIFTFLELFFISFGITLILIAIISYIIFEVPRQIGSGLLLLFAFGNIGAYLMLPFISYFFKTYNLNWFAIIFFFIITIFSIVLIIKLFTDPPYPKNIKKLKKGTKIFNELHYRLILFLIAAFLFGISENSFSTWGQVHLVHLFGQDDATQVIFFFWLFTILSQFTLSFFILLIDIKKIFFYLISLTALALFLFPHATNFSEIIGIYLMGALGCSGTFAAMVASLEKEIIYLTKKSSISFLPYIETSVAFMIAAYFLGVKCLTINVETIKNIYLIKTATPFYIGTFSAILIFIIMGFLFYTSYIRKEY